MNENDLIAEYVKERYPEILKTTELGKDFAATIKKLEKQISDALNGLPINAETKKQEGEQ